jgi:ribosomal protein L29
MKYIKEITPLADGELLVKLEELKKEHMFMRFQKKLGSIVPHAIKKVKKDIARVLTEINKRKNNKNA